MASVLLLEGEVVLAQSLQRAHGQVGSRCRRHQHNYHHYQYITIESVHFNDLNNLSCPWITVDSELSKDNQNLQETELCES